MNVVAVLPIVLLHEPVAEREPRRSDDNRSLLPGGYSPTRIADTRKNTSHSFRRSGEHGPIQVGNSPPGRLRPASDVAGRSVYLWATVLGALVPMLARRLGIDPALVSAPLITTLIDATGLAIYLLIARAILVI